MEENHREMQCQLQSIETIHQETQQKLQDMEKKNEDLQVMFDEALQRKHTTTETEETMENQTQRNIYKLFDLEEKYQMLSKTRRRKIKGSKSSLTKRFKETQNY